MTDKKGKPFPVVINITPPIKTATPKGISHLNLPDAGYKPPPKKGNTPVTPVKK